MNTSQHPALIGLDWGTSSLRAYLLGPNGTLIDRRAEGWGIQHLPAGGYPAAFRGVAGEWLDRWPALPVLAAGMVGSRNGWREVPYVECPADPASIASGLVAFDSGCGTIHLVPGLMQGGSLPDVMRGEEMQIVGALAMQPALAERSLLVLPGTHCKWAVLERGRVVRFTTYLTGELFAMLRDHSIIGRPAKEIKATAHLQCVPGSTSSDRSASAGCIASTPTICISSPRITSGSGPPRIRPGTRWIVPQPESNATSPLAIEAGSAGHSM